MGLCSWLQMQTIAFKIAHWMHVSGAGVAADLMWSGRHGVSDGGGQVSLKESFFDYWMAAVAAAGVAADLDVVRLS